MQRRRNSKLRRRCVQDACHRLFGGPVDILLHAATHRPDQARFGPKGSALNPGSATLPAGGFDPSFLRLSVTEVGGYGQVVRVV